MPELCFEVREMLSLEDDLLGPFLDLYQTAFPLNEQKQVSAIIRLLREKQAGESSEHHLLVAERHWESLGMAWYVVDDGAGGAGLWYLAVHPEHRCEGVGGHLYREVVRRARVEVPHLLWEVEIPEEQQDAQARQLAERRIRFYQRQGGAILRGIDYWTSTGWQPPVTMHLMAAVDGAPLDPESAFTLAQALFGDGVRRVGPLSLDAGPEPDPGVKLC